MPVNQKLLNSLIKKHGKEKGERVYYAMENKVKRHKSAGLKAPKIR